MDNLKLSTVESADIESYHYKIRKSSSGKKLDEDHALLESEIYYPNLYKTSNRMLSYR